MFADDLGNVRNGTGTCFFAMNKRNQLCLITNRHVFDMSYKQMDSTLSRFTLRDVKISGMLGSPGTNIPQSHFSCSIAPLIKFSKDENNDIACITNLVPLSDQDVRIDYFLPYSMLATEKDFQQRLSVCDFLAFPGFPEWHDKLANRPILRTGTISSDPRFSYSYKNDVRGECLAYEAFSYGGSSGSPVFAAQKGLKPGAGIEFAGYRELLLVGINAGHLRTPGDNSHSGISYLYKSTAIIETIDA